MSNWFSDMLGGVSDLIESIPVVGPVIKLADKIALNTDPSQLGTAAIGKIVGEDFEDSYTSEEARKGASHSIGAAALSYLLGGSEAAVSAKPATGASAAGLKAGASAAGATSAYQAGAAPVVGAAAAGMKAGVSAAAATDAYEAGAGAAMAGQGLLSNAVSYDKALVLLSKYLSGYGSDLMKQGENPDQPMQFTNANNVTAQQTLSQLQERQALTKLLSGEDVKVKADDKETAINTEKKSALYKQSMKKENWFKDNSLLASELSDSDSENVLTKFKSGKKTIPNQALVEVNRKRNFSSTNPFTY